MGWALLKINSERGKLIKSPRLIHSMSFVDDIKDSLNRSSGSGGSSGNRTSRNSRRSGENKFDQINDGSGGQMENQNSISGDPFNDNPVNGQNERRGSIDNQRPTGDSSGQDRNRNSGSRNSRNRGRRSGHPNAQAGRPQEGSSKPQLSSQTRREMENVGLNQSDSRNSGDAAEFEELKSQNEQIIELLKRINRNLEQLGR